ncbi:MAG: class I SAM-dependent methyltransferase [Myxococcales bacterium]|nr:class I SAM-dependent methyltransferase [Myxococcales bacterium]
MSQRTTGLRAVLSSAAVYQGLQDLLGGRRFQHRLVSEFVQPRPGTRLLDIGCGTAALLEHLAPDVAYHGFDLSERYVAAARRRWGARGQFWQASVADAPRLAGGRFDRATAIGVLHHLDDADARGLVRLAAAALTDDGALVTYDPAITSATSRAARFLIDRDRGQNVRTPAGYAAIVAAGFSAVEVVPVARHLRIPYTGCVIVARGPRRDQTPSQPA